MKKYTRLLVKEKKEFWKQNPINGEINIALDGISPFKMYSENDDTVVKELYWTDFKGWELTSLTLWKDLLKNSTEGVVYDIGCYSGIYSLIASTLSKKNEVYAFDVQQQCVDRLKKNIQINNINTIEVIRAACTEFNGETNFYFYEEDGIMTSVAGLVPKKMNILEQKVNAIKLDDFNNKHNLKGFVKLLKIDVEGAEIVTLKGLNFVLNEFSPDVLVEVNDVKDLKDVKKTFPKGYKTYDIDEDSLMIKKLKWLSKPSKHRNYLFTKKTKKILKSIFSGQVN